MRTKRAVTAPLCHDR